MICSNNNLTKTRLKNNKVDMWNIGLKRDKLIYKEIKTLMSAQKRNETSKNPLGLIWLIFLISNFILCLVGLEVLAQESDSGESSSSESKIELRRSFLDSNYKRFNMDEIVSEPELQIHPNAADKIHCNKCHEVRETTGAKAFYIVIGENSYELFTAACIKCHPQVATDHPVLITASLPVPKDLPLAKKREITCVTCHNPHFIRYSNHSWIPRTFLTKIVEFISSKKQYKTYFLRRNNAKKELCLACHKPVSPQWKFLYKSKEK